MALARATAVERRSDRYPDLATWLAMALYVLKQNHQHFSLYSKISKPTYFLDVLLPPKVVLCEAPKGFCG